MNPDQLTGIRQSVLRCAIDFGGGNPTLFTYLQEQQVTATSLEQWDIDAGAFLPTDESRLFQIAANNFNAHNQLIAPATINEEFVRRSIPDGVRGRYAALLDEIGEMTPVRAGELPYIVSRLKQYRAHHSATEILMAGAQMLRAGDIVGAMNLVQHRSAELVAGHSNLEPTETYSDVAAKRWLDYEDRAKNPLRARGVPTGFPQYDRRSGGLFPGDLLVVSGLPKQGKSALLLTFARNLCQQGYNPVFASGEMTTERVWERLDAMFTNLFVNAIRFGQLNDDDKKVYHDFLERAQKEKAQVAIIPPDRAIYLDQLHSEIRALQVRQKVDCLIADYIQIMEPSGGGRSDQDWQKVGRVAIELQRLGHALGIPVISASQVPEEYGKRTEDVYGGLSRSRIIGHTAASVWRIWIDPTIPDRMWVRVGASRHSEGDFTFALRADFARMQIVEELDPMNLGIGDL